MGLDLNINQIQELKLSTELISAITLLEYNTDELNSYLSKESENNIMIDYSPTSKDFKNTDSKKGYSKNFSSDEVESFENYIAKDLLLVDYLFEQLTALDLSKKELNIGYFIIENIDDDGYLRMTIDEISDCLKINKKDVGKILNIIKQFEPRGVASANLRDCLLAQVDNSDEKLVVLIEDYLEDIAKNKLDIISKSLNITIEEVQSKIKIIKSLNPIPSSGYLTDNTSTEYISPDFFVDVKDEKVILSFKDGFNPDLSVNNYYKDLMSENIDDSTKKYLDNKFNSASFLINAINQRNNTIKIVIGEIIDFQKEFFVKNDPLKIMTLKDIADLTDYSESTISRVTKNKYLQCEKGIYPLNYFFQSGLKSDNNNISKDYISKEILDIINNENKKKPLSDQKIADILNNKGIDIKRRTVAKYRTEMNILSTSLRKDFNG